MFNKLTVLPVFLLVVFCYVGCQHKIDIEAEKEAIKKAVQTQLDFAKALSADGESVWAHKSYVVRGNVISWDSVFAFYQTNFPKWKEEYQIDEFTAFNFDIHINANFAAVFHEEKMVGTYSGEDMTRVNRRLKYLEKINGEWKIIGEFNL